MNCWKGGCYSLMNCPTGGCWSFQRHGTPRSFDQVAGEATKKRPQTQKEQTRSWRVSQRQSLQEGCFCSSCRHCGRWRCGCLWQWCSSPQSNLQVLTRFQAWKKWELVAVVVVVVSCCRGFCACNGNGGKLKMKSLAQKAQKQKGRLVGEQAHK